MAKSMPFLPVTRWRRHFLLQMNTMRRRFMQAFVPENFHGIIDEIGWKRYNK
jgi:hypothetical protein